MVKPTTDRKGKNYQKKQTNKQTPGVHTHTAPNISNVDNIELCLDTQTKQSISNLTRAIEFA